MSGYSIDKFPPKFPPKVAAIVLRRCRDGWTYDEFNHDGKHVSGTFGSHGRCPVTYEHHVEWPDDFIRLRDLKMPGAVEAAPLPRVGLCRFTR